MEFQNKLCFELEKTWIKAHGYITLDMEQDVAKAQAAINELIGQTLKANLFIGGALSSYKNVSVLHTDRLRVAFGINKEEEKSDGTITKTNYHN